MWLHRIYDICVACLNAATYLLYFPLRLPGARLPRAHPRLALPKALAPMCHPHAFSKLRTMHKAMIVLKHFFCFARKLYTCRSKTGRTPKPCVLVGWLVSPIAGVLLSGEMHGSVDAPRAGVRYYSNMHLPAPLCVDFAGIIFIATAPCICLLFRMDTLYASYGHTLRFVYEKQTSHYYYCSTD